MPACCGRRSRGRSSPADASLAEPLLAAIPQKHPLAYAETITIKDFDGQPFVMYSPYESRYFHDLLVALFTRADILPRYVQHLSQIHSILAMVRAGLGARHRAGRGRQPEDRRRQAAPAEAAQRVPVELFMVWRRDDENPLLPALVEIAAMASAAAGGRLMLNPHRSIPDLAWTRIERSFLNTSAWTRRTERPRPYKTGAAP